MKRFSYLVLGATGLILASCSNEDVVSNIGNGDGTANVTLTLTTPEIKTRVISDGTTANKLYWALYEVTDNSGVQTLKKVTVAGDTENQYGNEDGEDFSMQTIKKLKLVDGKTYGFVFWAANDQAPYSVEFTDDGAKMTAKYNDPSKPVKANDEALDAFYAYVTLPVNGDVQLNVPMNRPFAQINIGTNDLKESKALGYTPVTSTIKVQSYTTLDLVSGKVETSTPATWTFTHNDIPAETEIFPAGAEYNYLATTYILMSEDQKTVNVQFDYASGDELTTQDNHVRTVGSVPVKRNHRTNIYGQILTGNAELLVYIEPEFMEPDLEPSPLQMVAALGGTVKLEEDFDFNEEKINRIYFKKDAIVDLNGKTVTGSNVNNGDADGTFFIQDGANLTITGDGVIESAGNYGSILVWAANGDVTIESGTFKSQNSGEIIYIGNEPVKGTFTGGTVYIKGGTFIPAKESNGEYSCLNCNDGAFKAGLAKFVVTGGTFYNWDPSKSTSEPAPENPKNWVAEGYKVVVSSDDEGNTIYTVVPNDTYEVTAANVNSVFTQLKENGGNAILKEDVSVSKFDFDKETNIDLNGKTLTASQTGATDLSEDLTISNGELVFTVNNGNKIILNATEGATLTLEKIEGNFNNGSVSVAPGSELRLINCNIKGVFHAISNNASNATAATPKVTVYVENCKLNAATPLFNNVPADITAIKSEFTANTQSVVIRGGDGTFEDCVFNISNNTDYKNSHNPFRLGEVQNWDQGNMVTVGGLIAGNYNNTISYQYPTNITLKGKNIFNISGTYANETPAIHVCANQGEGMGASLNYVTADVEINYPAGVELMEGYQPIEIGTENVLVNGQKAEINCSVPGKE